MQLTETEQKVIEKFEKFILEKNPSNEFLVQFIELAGKYLNLETIPDYAKRTGKSYNGIKNNRNIRNLFNVKFVIDNE
jgi:hypothetical protein